MLLKTLAHVFLIFVVACQSIGDDEEDDSQDGLDNAAFAGAISNDFANESDLITDNTNINSKDTPNENIINETQNAKISDNQGANSKNLLDEQTQKNQISTNPQPLEEKKEEKEQETKPVSSSIPNLDLAYSPFPLRAKRRILAGGEAPIEYIVEPFDTLYTICDQLLDDGDYWPKLWALNPFIKNPHMIYPGMRLSFYPGDEEKAPFMAVATHDDILPLDENGESGEFTNILNEAVYLKNEVTTMQKTEIIGPDDLSEIKNDLTEIGNIYNQKNIHTHIPGFMLEQEPDELCSILSGVMGESVIGSGSAFFCDCQDSKVEQGKTYTILRYRDNFNSSYGTRIYLYEYIAQMQFTSNSEVETVIGEVKEGRKSIEKGDIVVPYKATRRNVSAKNESTDSQIEATIVAFTDEGQSVAAQGEFVYIDVGYKDGVAKDQVLPIYEQKKNPLLYSYRQKLDARMPKIGSVKIIDANEHGAVGYIVYNKQEIWLGDKVGAL